MHRVICYVFLCTLLLVLVNAAQLDPIKNMCFRWDHESVIKHDTLFIDGGRQTFQDVEIVNGKETKVGAVTEGYNKYLITVDLVKSWDWKTNISLNANFKDKNPKTGTSVPVTSIGTLYEGGADDHHIYLWGGSTSPLNTSSEGNRTPLPSQYSLWPYSVTEGTWGQVDTGLTIDNRPSGGASAEAPEQGLGFYFNGQLTSRSETQTKFTMDADAKQYLGGMVVIDTNKQTARNLSTQAVVGDYPRSRGKMQYVKDFGAKGILVQIGGNQKHIQDQSKAESDNLVPMDNIWIFDVASYYDSNLPDGVWYNQTTTGDTPPPRIDHCLMVAAAPDGTSQNVYVYGGRTWNGTHEVALDDIYILSLPSFTWTQMYKGASPRYGHTCHRAKPNVMLTVGGHRYFNFTKQTCDWELKGVGVLDMSEVEWGSVYDANATDYRLPVRLVDTIGGDRMGKANMTQPLAGFEKEGLAQMFHGTVTSKRKKRSSIPFIVGGTIGGIAFLATIATFVFLYRRRLQNFITGGEWPPAEMDAKGQEKAEMGADPIRQELPPAPVNVKFIEPAPHPVELCVRESDLPWRELQARASDPPPPWEPPVTDEGVPF